MKVVLVVKIETESCVCVYIVQEVYRVAQGLLTRAREDRENGLTYIQSGWALIAAYISLGTILSVFGGWEV